MLIKKKIISVLNRLPYIRGLYQEKRLFEKNSKFPPGHFLSPIVSIDEIKERENDIWAGESVSKIEGIELNACKQLKLLESFEQFYSEIPFSGKKTASNKYYFDNELYSYTDAIILYSMLRSFKPKRIIEVGSGFSSLLMLDVKQKFLPELELTFIEPFPVRLFSLLTDKDKNEADIKINKIQDIEMSVFDQLGENDILFIDSTHVSKTGSDVNHTIFNILPKLKPGVLIHFHDIFYPFEYPKEWVFGGYSWNEIYMLRAFLMYNNVFNIELFSSYLHMHHKEAFENMPLCYKHTGGNIWLRKVG